MHWLIDALATHHDNPLEVRSLNAIEVMALNDHSRVFVVLEGYVDVFYQPDVMLDDGISVSGLRHHVLRCEVGDIICGFTAPGMVGVATNETRVIECTLDELVSFGREEEMISRVVKLFDVWVEHLSSGLSVQNVPTESVSLSNAAFQQEPVMLESGASITAEKGKVVWVPLVGGLRLFGEFDITENTQMNIPVASSFWLSCTQKIDSLECNTTAGSLSSDQYTSYLEGFHRLFLTLFGLVLEKQTLLEKQEAQHRQETDARVMKTGLGRLSNVLKSRSADPITLSADPLVATSQVIGKHLNIEISLPYGGLDALKRNQDPLSSIARASGFKIRRINLTGQWWEADMGPLLAYTKSEKTPVALIPLRPGHYQIVTPGEEEPQVVTASVANEIADNVVMFYRPFPDGDVGLYELYKFIASGLKRDAILIGAMITLTGVLSMGVPIVTGMIVGTVIPEAMLDQLTVLIIALVIIALASTGFNIVKLFAIQRIEGYADYQLQSAVWDRLLSKPAIFFRKYSVGELSNRVQGIDRVRAIMSSSFVTSLMVGVTGIFSAGLMLYYNWKLATLTFVIAFILLIFNYFLGRRIVYFQEVLFDLLSAVQSQVFQYLTAISKLRVAGAEARAFSKWADTFSQYQSNTLRKVYVQNALTTFNGIFPYLSTALIIFFVGWKGDVLLSFFKYPQSWQEIDSMSLKESFSAATFIAFYAAFGQFISAVTALSQTSIGILTAKPYLEKLQPILKGDVENHTSAEDIGEVSGNIEVNAVQFRYAEDAPLVLQGLSLSASKGEFIALVGPSGAGKSSIVRLLLGFESAEAGSIYIDGHDIEQVDKISLRRNYGVVLQNGRLLPGTLYQNIIAGSDLSVDDAWEAAAMAGLEQDIKDMPMGMHTVISEGGGTLSGGQKQRLMIARAIVRKPRILIFDEATSALDNETQAIVSKSLDNLHCTRIVIAHRLSTIINADRIFVVDKGQAVESGTHDELMAKDGLYAQLALRQMT